MHIELNGERTNVPEPLTVADLIAHLDLGERRIAVEVNEDVVPRSQFAQTHLQPDDRVEIIHAIGGG
ncbi:sulfur carrier protein ThiS [Aquisalimonas asiatica]|uniref:Sulfur carrier protein ThiS n=1 Tax=Aquisalimonas asiatica TaxID=406100 RepID=A0A1H8VF41_9GAMM|nr:sulfur carrier protein ThiS [Aquisalimonas asiatica]SEP13884.1 sulfur carrier protein ThiS [Aquisalimonas asiatica]